MPYRTCHFLRPIDDQVLAFDVAYEEDKISVAPDTSPRSWSCLTFWAWSFVNIDKFSPTNQKLKHGLRVIIWQDIPFSQISRKFVNMQFFFVEIYQATKKLICYPYLGFAVGKNHLHLVCFATKELFYRSLKRLLMVANDDYKKFTFTLKI